MFPRHTKRTDTGLGEGAVGIVSVFEVAVPSSAVMAGVVSSVNYVHWVLRVAQSFTFWLVPRLE